MSQAIQIELPDDLAPLTLPEGVDRRLRTLLDKQDEGAVLSEEEALEAEGLVNLAEWMSLLRLRSDRPR